MINFSLSYSDEDEIRSSLQVEKNCTHKGWKSGKKQSIYLQMSHQMNHYPNLPKK